MKLLELLFIFYFEGTL